MKREIIAAAVLTLLLTACARQEAAPRYAPDTRQVTVTELHMEDVEALCALPNLEAVDASGCTDYPALLELSRRLPDCKVVWQVGPWHSEEHLLHAENADIALLRESLPWLPRAAAVQMTGKLPEPEEIKAMEEAFPEVEFFWDVTVGGKTISSRSSELNLNGEFITADDLNGLIARLPNLTHAELLDCGLLQEELLALTEAWPQVEFLWEMELFGKFVRTDAEEIDLSQTPISDVTELERRMACFYNLKKVDMCGCGVDNETMDALNRRHEDVQYVWDVQICWRRVRTDITWFFPFRLDVDPRRDDLYNLRYCTEVECVDIGHALVHDIEWAAYMPKLKYMLFGDTAVSDISPLADHKELVYLEMFKTPVTDYTPLLSCTALEDLNLGYTYGDAEVIAQMTWLKNLWWHRPTPPWGGPETQTRLNLGTLLPDTYVDVNYTDSSTGDGWRKLPNYYAQRDFLGMGYMD